MFAVELLVFESGLGIEKLLMLLGDRPLGRAECFIALGENRCFFIGESSGGSRIRSQLFEMLDLFAQFFRVGVERACPVIEFALADGEFLGTQPKLLLQSLARLLGTSQRRLSFVQGATVGLDASLRFQELLRLRLDQSRLFGLLGGPYRKFHIQHSQSLALSRDLLLDHVWGKEYMGDPKIVDVNIRRLRQKIETNPSEPAFLQTVWGHGYKWKGEGQ